MVNEDTETIFKAFYAMINTNVTGVTITPSFQDDEKALPQVIINKPKVPRKRLTYGTTRYNRDGGIDIEVLATSSKLMSELIDEVSDVCMSNYKTDTTVKDLELEISDNFRQDTGNKSAHGMVISFTFKRRD